jgi:hypothetical protein
MNMDRYRVRGCARNLMVAARVGLYRAELDTDYAFASGLLERIAGKSTRRFCPVEHSGLLTALVLAGRASTPKTYAGNGCSAAATNFETSSLIHNA